MTSSITSTGLAGNTISAAASAGGSAGGTASTTQFETFLRMLTTQIKNQDPLNPMEGTEFAVQLATFSGVEQQVQTNTLLTRLLSEGSGGELGQFSGWIGREVRTSAPVWHDGSPLRLELDDIGKADRAFLLAMDAQGREIMREEILPGTDALSWSGRRANGEALPAGMVSFRVEAQQDGKVSATGGVQARTTVTGVEMTPEGARLVLAGGARATVGQITALGSGPGDY